MVARCSLGRMSRRLVLSVYALFCVLTLTALATPIVLGDRIEPMVLGLPFPLAWSAGWVVLAFVALATMHTLAGGESEE